MYKKTVNFQISYELTDEYPYYARNKFGMLMGFANAPIRDFETGEWLDCVTGSNGELILFAKWDTSVRKFDDFQDAVGAAGGVIKVEEQFENAEVHRIKLKEKRDAKALRDSRAGSGKPRSAGNKPLGKTRMGRSLRGVRWDDVRKAAAYDDIPESDDAARIRSYLL